MTATVAGFQASLFDAGAPLALGPLGPTVRRERLAGGAWVDTRPGWVSGADEVFARLADTVPWQAERRQMYDRVVDVPRLLRFYDERDPLPDPLLVQVREALDAHYGPELGEPFRTVGMCLYRDGRDSVAWHGDRIGRGSTHDTMVAIVSFGAPRTLALRPVGGGGGGGSGGGGGGGGGGAGGGGVRRYELGHGDLVVMGGSCQRTWEHAVPKVAAAGPRISVQFRPFNVF